MDDVVHQPLVSLASALRSREISPVELTAAVLDQIAARDSALGAYIAVYHDEALSQARSAADEISNDRYRGPLHGIPMGIKDNFYVMHRTTTMGSKIHAEFQPDYDATAVRKLGDAGAILLGKLNMHEYALGVTTENPHFGTCHNPWNLAKSPGGSSGGAGAAIPTGMSIGSIGSDTSGSIRIPAACCGIVGLKPTYGRISKFGCFPEAWTLDHVGPMGRTVADVAVLLDALSGYDPQDPTALDLPRTDSAALLSSDITGLVVGVNQSFFLKDVDSSVAAAVDCGVRYLEEQGAKIQPVDIPCIEDAEYAITIIDTSETSTVHHQALQDRPDDYGDDVRFLLQRGELPSAVDYLRAQQIRSHLTRSLAQVFDEVDVLVGPTLPIETPDIGQTTSSIDGAPVDTVESLMRLVGPANLLGLPSLSVPCGSINRMPVGLQIIGPPLGEQTVLNFGQAIEESELFILQDPSESAGR